MDQRVFAIGFIIITVIIVIALLASQANQKLAGIPNPTTSSGLALSSNSALSAGTSAQPAPSSSPSGALPNRNLARFPELAPDQLANKEAVINTSKGQIVFQIYPEATKAASNFIYLANNHFYNGLTFHRVEPGFVIQGGDPSGNGTGGPGYQFEDEPVTMEYKRGIVAMANAGPNTNGSQFFIMLADHPELPPNYTIFGNVVSGMDVVDKIAVGDVMTTVIIGDLK